MSWTASQVALLVHASPASPIPALQRALPAEYRRMYLVDYRVRRVGTMRIGDPKIMMKSTSFLAVAAEAEESCFI